MIEGLKEPKNPNAGAWAVVLIEMLIPVIAALICCPIIMKYETLYPQDLNFWSGMTIAGSVGVVFSISVIIAGPFIKELKRVIKRWKEFFEDLKLSFEVARESYKLNLQEEGCMFWVFLLALGLNIAWFTVSLIKALTLLQPFL